MDTNFLKIGDTLEGKYVIVNKIGEGGMGVVYEGTHRDLEMRVAIKVLHPLEAGDDSMKNRFKVEAKSSASIKHPNVVEVYDYGITPDGRPFFVMEHLEGESLADLLDRRKVLRQSRAVDILDQILSGLARAHKKNIIHRDLKPENIFLAKTDEGKEVVKVLDFGIAKIMGDTHTSQSSAEGQMKQTHATTRFKTERGVVMGTPGYMAPETLTGQAPVDSRADLFSVGVLLFEMLTGRQPFGGSTAHDIMMATATKPVPKLKAINPQISKEMEQLCLIALAKNPDDRFQDATEFIEYLTAAAVGRIPEFGRQCKTNVGMPSMMPGAPGAKAMKETMDLDLADADDRIRKHHASNEESAQFLHSTTSPDSPYRKSTPYDSHRSYPPAALNHNTPDSGGYRGYQRSTAGNYVGPARTQRLVIPFSLWKIVLFLAIVGGAAYFVLTSSIFQAPTVSNADSGYKINNSVSEMKAKPLEQALPDKVTIWVEVEPSDADILWNGELITDRPLRVSSGNKPVKVEVVKKGYQKKILVVTPNEEQTIRSTLKEDKKRKRKKRKRRF